MHSVAQVPPIFLRIELGKACYRRALARERLGERLADRPGTEQATLACVRAQHAREEMRARPSKALFQ
jgi:hypothetical protein